jgi:hypothetical protein
MIQVKTCRKQITAIEYHIVTEHVDTILQRPHKYIELVTHTLYDLVT